MNMQFSCIYAIDHIQPSALLPGCSGPAAHISVTECWAQTAHAARIPAACNPLTLNASSWDVSASTCFLLAARSLLYLELLHTLPSMRAPKVSGCRCCSVSTNTRQVQAASTGGTYCSLKASIVSRCFAIRLLALSSSPCSLCTSPRRSKGCRGGDVWNRAFGNSNTSTSDDPPKRPSKHCNSLC